MCGIAGLLGPPGDPSARAGHGHPDGHHARSSRPGRLGRLGPTRAASSGSASGACRSSTCRPPGISRWPRPTAGTRSCSTARSTTSRRIRERAGAGRRTFRGRSDTEVMLAAVAAGASRRPSTGSWGMFAFALWDAQRARLHLARDRLGKKPLYYGWQGDTFLFGSELKALRAHPALRGRRSTATRWPATCRYAYVPAPRSIYAGIRKLPPGSHLVGPAGSIPGELRRAAALLGSGQPSRRTARRTSSALADEEAIDALETAAGRRGRGSRMVADVPLGAFLSGGIDSSHGRRAHAGAVSTRPVATFTIGFERCRVRRVEPRPGRRRAPRHRPHRAAT